MRKKGHDKKNYRALSAEAYELAVNELMGKIRQGEVSAGVLVEAIPVLANYAKFVSVDQETARMVAMLDALTSEQLQPEQREVLLKRFTAQGEEEEAGPSPQLNSVPLDEDESE